MLRDLVAPLCKKMFGHHACDDRYLPCYVHCLCYRASACRFSSFFCAAKPSGVVGAISSIRNSMSTTLDPIHIGVEMSALVNGICVPSSIPTAPQTTPARASTWCAEVAYQCNRIHPAHVVAMLVNIITNSAPPGFFTIRGTIDSTQQQIPQATTTSASAVIAACFNHHSIRSFISLLLLCSPRCLFWRFFCYCALPLSLFYSFPSRISVLAPSVIPNIAIPVRIITGPDGRSMINAITSPAIIITTPSTTLRL